MDFLKHLMGTGFVWLLPFTFTAFVLLSMLLFVGELPEHMRRYLLLSIVVFLIGLGFIIFWKELWHIRYRVKNRERVEEEKRKNPTKLAREDSVEVLCRSDGVVYCFHRIQRLARRLLMGEPCIPRRLIAHYSGVFLWAKQHNDTNLINQRLAPKHSSGTIER
jgi:hypothetical protein